MSKELDKPNWADQININIEFCDGIEYEFPLNNGDSIKFTIDLREEAGDDE